MTKQNPNFASIRRMCQDCPQAKSGMCYEHAEYIQRESWLMWPRIKYNGTTNAERYVAKYGWPKNGFQKEHA